MSEPADSGSHTPPVNRHPRWLRLGALLLSGLIFWLDTITPLGVAIPALYVVPVLLFMRGGRPWEPMVVATGATALTSHAIKTALRLGINASPEPFSNIIVSLAEDAAVAGVVALALVNLLFLVFVLVQFRYLFALDAATGREVWRFNPFPEGDGPRSEPLRSLARRARSGLSP